jgi:hypothetical protein
MLRTRTREHETDDPPPQKDGNQNERVCKPNTLHTCIFATLTTFARDKRQRDHSNQQGTCDHVCEVFDVWQGGVTIKSASSKNHTHPPPPPPPPPSLPLG